MTTDRTILNHRTKQGFTLFIAPAPGKGEKVGYSALHGWVRRHKGQPNACIDCAATEQLTWSNTNGLYRRRLDDFVPRCRSCHAIYDNRPGMKGAIKRKWSKA